MGWLTRLFKTWQTKLLDDLTRAHIILCHEMQLAAASLRAKFLSILHYRTYFFYFTHSFYKTPISVYLFYHLFYLNNNISLIFYYIKQTTTYMAPPTFFFLCCEKKTDERAI